jgi:hypothetical protein
MTDEEKIREFLKGYPLSGQAAWEALDRIMARCIPDLPEECTIDQLSESRIDHTWYARIDAGNGSNAWWAYGTTLRDAVKYAVDKLKRAYPHDGF